MPGGGDRPVAKEVAAMALPIASNDEKLRIKGLGRRFGFLPVHHLEVLFDGPPLILRRLVAELGAILPLVAFSPGFQDVDRVTLLCLLQN